MIGPFEFEASLLAIFHSRPGCDQPIFPGRPDRCVSSRGDAMTLKIVQGLVGTSSRPVQAKSAPAQDVRQSASQQAAVARAVTGEAVLTTVYSSARKVGVGDSIPSFERAKDVARDVADRIREERDTEAHQALEELGTRGVVGQHLI